MTPKLTKAQREALTLLVDVWINDGQVANYHKSWIEMADLVGRGVEARAHAALYDDGDDERAALKNGAK